MYILTVKIISLLSCPGSLPACCSRRAVNIASQVTSESAINYYWLGNFAGLNIGSTFYTFDY